MTADPKRDELRAFLDRRHVYKRGDTYRAWHDWFAADGAYLGTVSARTGPDDVQAAQRCGCGQCVKRTETARHSTNDTETGQGHG